MVRDCTEVVISPSQTNGGNGDGNGGGGQNDPPVAQFVYSPPDPLAGEVITFDASESSDPDGTIATYEWDFGDGSTDAGQTVTHTYASAGEFFVELTVTDDEGTSDTIAQEVLVQSAGNGNGGNGGGNGDGNGDEPVQAGPSPAVWVVIWGIAYGYLSRDEGGR